MKIHRVTLRNFMPYKDGHSVDFPKHRDRNVLLIYGENMRGKTSFLNGIRWALYGEALDRSRKVVPLVEIVNMDARDSGDWTFGATITFASGGNEYELNREASPRESVSSPRRDSDFRVEVRLKKNGNVVRADEVEHEINQVMPQQTSRFFLFDAELLAEYEELLIQESEAGKRIRLAIEQVLGVPAMLNGRSELKTLQRNAQEVLAKENQHSEATKLHAESFKTYGVQLDAHTADFTSLTNEEEVTRSEMTALEAELSRTEAAEKLSVRMDAIRLEMHRLYTREAQLKEERLEISSGAWRDVLQPRLKARICLLESQRAQFVEAIERYGALKERLAQLRRIIASGLCDVCGQGVNATEVRRREQEAVELAVEAETSRAQLDEAGRISAEIQRLSSISATGALVRLRHVETELDRTAVDITRYDEEIADLQTELETFDSEEIARRRARLKALIRHHIHIQDKLKEMQGRIDDLQAKRDQLSRLMAKAPTERTRRSALEVDIYTSLAQIFSTSVDVLREKLRASVQQRATAAFKQITTEKTYASLQLNESYGLTILDKSNRPVGIRSAGAEQVVALSLIDGLNKTAGTSGPVIIDTPLGRLDPKHRQNVLNYVTGMAEQVVLLVHEGELDRSGGTEEFRSRIDSVYEIRRLSSSHSRISKV